MRDADKQYLADHYYDFFAIAYAIMQNEEEAKDAVQEALATTMAAPLVRNVHSYCAKVLRNYCCDRLKENYVLIDTFDDRAMDTSTDTMHERRISLLRRLKAQLPAETTMLLDLHYERGMTMAQIAEMTGKPQHWVKRRIMKSLHQLRENIMYEESRIKEI